MPSRAAADPVASLPLALHPPVDVALARVATAIPAPTSLPGGCLYEPKWDGFRLVVVRDGDSTSVWSRQRKDLTRAFPDLAAAAARQVPPGCVLDGEAVVWRDGRLDFDALQRRLGVRSAAPLARAEPATFAAFDLLGAAGQDVRRHPLRVRRALLEELAADWSPPLAIAPASTDAAQAAAWFADLPAVGIEGLVVKGLEEPYPAGARSWLKVKHHDTVEVVVGAVLGPIARPTELVVGLPVDGLLRIAGRSAPLKPAAAARLGRHLRPPRGPHPWPSSIIPGALGRFGGRRDPVDVTLVEPVVVEVVADAARSNGSFRHAVRFVRPRPELVPDDLAPRRLPTAG